MGAVTGISFLVQVNTGTNDVPIWTTVAGQRNAALNRSADEVDFTSKDTEGWYEGIPSFKNWGIDFDGLIVEDDEGYLALEEAFMNSEIIKVQLTTAAGNKFSGFAYLTDFPIEAPYDAEATYSGTLQGTGKLEKI